MKSKKVWERNWNIKRKLEKESQGCLRDFLKLATWAKFAPVYVHDQLVGEKHFFQFSKKQKAMIFNGLCWEGLGAGGEGDDRG